MIESELEAELTKPVPEQKRINEIIAGCGETLELCLPSAIIHNKHRRNLAIKKISEALKNNKKCKFLYGNCLELDDEDALSLAEMLQENDSICNLNLMANKIGDKGVQAMVEMLKKNVHLQALNLECNPLLTLRSAQSLEQVIRTQKNKTLYECRFAVGTREMWIIQERVTNYLSKYFDGTNLQYFLGVDKEIQKNSLLLPELSSLVLEYLAPHDEFKKYKNRTSNQKDSNYYANYLKLKQSRKDYFFWLFSFSASVLCLAVLICGICAEKGWDNSIAFLNGKIANSNLSHGTLIGLATGFTLLLFFGAYFWHQQQKLRNYVPNYDYLVSEDSHQASSSNMTIPT
jgi:hypothetical protein